jgi:hypothetical protein
MIACVMERSAIGELTKIKPWKEVRKKEKKLKPYPEH